MSQDQTNEHTKKALKQGVKGSKVVAKGTKKFILWLIGLIGGFVFLIILLIVMIVVVTTSYFVVNSEANCIYTNVNIENIEFLIPTIEKYMGEEEIDLSYKPVILAQVHQESGDDEIILQTDPFQSSEYSCGSIGCITDYDTSTKEAMSLHRENIKKFHELELGGSVEDAVLQAYNFGTGYLDWLASNNLEQSQSVAYAYSLKMTRENPSYASVCPQDPAGLACYGDYKYVEHVHRKGGFSCGNLKGNLSTLPEMADTYTVTQGYGAVSNPGTVDGWHDGIDLAGVDGALIYTAGDGEVVFSGQDNAGANVVRIKHSEELYTTYAHLKEPSDLEVGDLVNAGDIVGYQGSTGNSTGSHLHFEVRNDNSFNVGREYTDDPEKYLPIEENQM